MDEALTKQMHDLVPFTGELALDVLEASPAQVVGRAEWAPERCTAGGVLHGGYLMAVVDSVGAPVRSDPEADGGLVERRERGIHEPEERHLVAALRNEIASYDGRRTHRQVGHHEDYGQHAGPFAWRRKGDHDPDRSLDARAESSSGDHGPQEERRWRLV